MNAIRSTVIFALLAAALARPLGAHNGSVAIAVPLQGIAVDGDLSDWPPGLVEYPITFPEWGDAPVNEEDFQGVFRVGYSVEQNSLYVAVEVSDESVVLDSTVVAHWNTQEGSGLPVALHGDSSVEVIGISGYEMKYNTLTAPSALATMTTPGGRIYEYVVDAGSLGDGQVRLEPGTMLGFDVVVHDKDEDGSFSWIAWGRGINKSGHPDSYERLGDLVLVTEGAMAPAASPDPRPEVVVAGADRLAEAMDRGDADRVRQLVGEGGWYTLRGKSGELFNGFSLGNWWPLSDQWGVRDGQIVCPTSDRIHFLISEYVAGEPFQLRYEVAALDRSPGDGKMVGFVDAAGDNVLVALDDDEPHTIQIDSGRKVFDASGVRGPWKMETSAGLQMQVGKWYEVVCTVDGTNFTVSTGDVELQHPFEPQFPVFIWLEVQRTGARFRGLRISKL